MKTNKQKAFRTKRLELRPLRLSDFKAWAAAHASALPKQSEWDITPVATSKRTQSRYARQLKAQRVRFKKDEVYLWTMFSRETGEFVGWIDISKIARGHYQIANLGWFTMNQYRKLGYANEATMKLISVAFTDLGFHRLEASIHPCNKASIKMAKSCGLQFESLRKFYLKVDDAWQDHVVYVTTPELFYKPS